MSFVGKQCRRLSAKRLRKLLSYDPETGIFRWKVTVCSRAVVGGVAGTFHLDRNRIQVDGCRHIAADLAWLYMTGKWPSVLIDHADTDPSNDRFNNLREADFTLNNINKKIRRDNTSGFKGVKRDPRLTVKPWQGMVSIKGARLSIGHFRTRREAGKAVREANAVIYRQFARAA